MCVAAVALWVLARVRSLEPSTASLTGPAPSLLAPLVGVSHDQLSADLARLDARIGPWLAAVRVDGLSRNLSPDLRAAYSQRTGRTVAEGADTAVWLAATSDVEGATGGFYFDRQELPCEFRDESDQERLWDICQDLTAPSMPI